MEVVDVGSLPADEVLDLLFEGQALKSLLGGHGAACFALVRPMVAPHFYRELIENSATLDATTRRHVAFVVFYGDHSGVVREEHFGYGQYAHRTGLRTRLEGLSISEYSDILTDVVLPSKATPERGDLFRSNHDLFSEELGGRIRKSPEYVNQALFAQHMSRVATHLMEIYNVRESSLPCLLFADGRDLKNHLVVPLNPEAPLASLYTHVLRPLSNQFSALSNYWRRRADFTWRERIPTESADKVSRLSGEIADVEAATEWQRQIIPQRMREELQEFEMLKSARAKKLDARALATSVKADEVEKMMEELAAISQGKRDFRSLGHREMEMAKLEKRLSREQQSLAALRDEVLDEESPSIRSKRYQIEHIRDLVPDLERRRKQLEERLKVERKLIENNSPATLSKEKSAIRQMAVDLESVGYGPEILEAESSSAFAAIEVMFRNGLLGFRASTVDKSELHPMRILFLAANPTSTSRLDLEEELRSLELELLGVKYRDQVVLTARHAVRPDDLVRYIRSERPTVVHFSGHGSGQGIVLRTDEGGYTEVTGPSLQRFFLDRGVRLVVLNACYTQEQAKLLPGAVAAVVGTTDTVEDRAAHRFTVAFYRALGNGYSIREAFRDGGDAVALDNRKDVFWSAGELDQTLVAPNAGGS